MWEEFSELYDFYRFNFLQIYFSRAYISCCVISRNKTISAEINVNLKVQTYVFYLLTVLGEMTYSFSINCGQCIS